MPSKFYAVKVGKTPGIYYTWDECKANVDGFSGAEYKSFKTIEEAKQYLGINDDYVQLNLFGEFEENESDVDAKSEIIQTAPGEMTAYVDGSYDIVSHAYSYGLVAFLAGEVIRMNQAYYDDPLADMRNVAGEIKGSEAAMQLALEKGCHTLNIYHDYEGIAKWPLGEWKTNKEGTIAYKEFYQSVRPKLNITFHKVTGHSGDKYNDEADRLAKEALGIE